MGSELSKRVGRERSKKVGSELSMRVRKALSRNMESELERKVEIELFGWGVNVVGSRIRVILRSEFSRSIEEYTYVHLGRQRRVRMFGRLCMKKALLK